MNDERKGPNTNCLDGMRCPRCGSYEPFTIYGLTGNAVVYDEGTEEVTGIEWEDDAECKCGRCEFDGLVREFKTKWPYRCVACKSQHRAFDDLRPIQAQKRRPSPSGPKPSGACPICGGRCYPEIPEQHVWEFVVTPFEDFDLEEVRS